MRVLLVVMSITIYGCRIQVIGYRTNSGMHAIAQSIVATWQCLNKSPPFILIESSERGFEAKS